MSIYKIILLPKNVLPTNYINSSGICDFIFPPKKMKFIWPATRKDILLAFKRNNKRSSLMLFHKCWI